MKKDRTEIELHVAGATVRHDGPFNSLVSFSNDADLTPEFLEQWVIPYYFNLKNQDDVWIERMIAVKDQVNDEIILKNLGDFNWRTRSTGAYFAAIKGARQFTGIIGVHLLKSEVCFAGRYYAIALATFNTSESVEYMNKYLQYYLKRLDLDFDQHAVMSALKYLDELNGTKFCEDHKPAWIQFCANKIQHIEKSIKTFQKQEALGMAEAFEGHLKFWHQEVSSKPVADAVAVINRISTTNLE